MRTGFLLCVLLLISCGKSDGKNSKPLFQLVPQKTVAAVKPTPGYDKYVKSCTRDVKDEKVCACQADILKKYLKDDDIGMVAESGAAVGENDAAKTQLILGTLPDVKRVVEKAAVEADKICK